ncbi:MAG TPA: nucleoside triphosphate pyrophosphohydrolase [Mycobacteriales bacterium]|nr:nucleoside triphosphate pyrophosphohydrolase [Mycobacteriales bacterium]
MPDRVVLLATSPRVAPGLLSWPAWETLRTGVALTGDPEHPQLEAVRHAGIDVDVLDGEPEATARELRERARAVPAVWLVAPEGDDALLSALRALGDAGLEVEVLDGSFDLPGARLLDVVTTMDRLRSPGGCPWDAQQTHESLGPYLLEEAYEAFEAIEEGDRDALREELGDVLLQVAFHARVAQEDTERPWSIDDVASGLVDKLVRRHPHVFADVEVAGADDVVANWDVIKTEEKRRTSVTDGVAMSQPALTLAATLQRKATKLGLPPGLLSPEIAAAETPGQAVSAAAAVVEERSGVDTVGELLWAAVLLARLQDVDPEAALRGRARAFRDRLAEVEREARSAGLDPKEFDVRQWQQRWEGR